MISISIVRQKESVQSRRYRNWTLLVLTVCEYYLIDQLQIQNLLQDRAEDAGGAV
jgi:hypothetical protein